VFVYKIELSPEFSNFSNLDNIHWVESENNTTILDILKLKMKIFDTFNQFNHEIG
jgi:hypothetical protein